jgi:GntR family transcriptional regulator/MocR family aminotransferase
MLRICTALHAAGHTALAVEDPGPTRLWQAAILAGLQLVPIDVDADGLVVEQLADHPQVRAVLVGAAHQCPTGVVLAPHRRAQVLRWARDVDGLIIEDDYDAEYRYDRPATATFQGMEPRRVALIGSVSRTLGPAVGIGWAVTPPRWTSPIRHDDFLRLMPPVLNQLALAVMLESGAYDRHLRAARARFRARRAVLLDRLAMDLPDCRVRAAEAGLDILLELPAGRDAWLAVVAARKRGLLCSTLNAFRMRPARQAAPTIVLSYGNLADSAVGEAVGILADAIAGATIRPGVSGPAVTRAVPLQAPADVGTGRPE